MRLSKSSISLLIASLLCDTDSLTLDSEFAVDIEELHERETLWCVCDDRGVQAREKYLDCELDRKFRESRDRECEFRDDRDLCDCEPRDLDRDLHDRESLVRDFCDRDCRDLEFRE